MTHHRPAANIANSSRVQTPFLTRCEDTFARDDECRCSQRDLMPVGIRPNLSQRFDDKRIEPRVNLIFRPIETREVLHPFEIADCHATGIADDVGNQKNAASSENVIGGG